MDPNIEDYIDQRLMVFDDDLDLNDWFEIFAGATMGGLGIFYLFNPIEAFDSNVISFFAAFIASVGLIWAMNGLKDMAVKDMRRSVLALEATNRQNTVDYGLIRDVLLNPSQYRSFLMEAYERAFEDGQIDDEELEELRSIQAALGMSDQEAQAVAVRAAVSAALKDGHLSEVERGLIRTQASMAGASAKDIDHLIASLEDGSLDPEDEDLLNRIADGASQVDDASE